MVFKSEKMINGTSVWELDTDTQTVRHINSKTNETEHFTFHADHIRYHLHYVEDYQPERLQKLVDEGEIYKYLDELDIKVTDAVNAQAQKYMDSDRDYQAALEIGDLYKLGKIGNMLREQAKEPVFTAMVYV